MGTSDISGIGKVLVQGQTAGVKGSSQEEELKVAFTEVMSQMSAMAGDELVSKGQLMKAGAVTVPSASSVDAEFSRCGNQGVKIQENSKAELKHEELSEKTEAFADDVKEVLKEELGVSEEQIEEAMETLGLTFSDLLNPNQLAALVAELTGAEDMGILLCSEEFMTIMQEVGALSEKLLQEAGVTSDELAQLLEDPKSSIGDAKLSEQMIQENDNLQVSESVTDAITKNAETRQSPDEIADGSESTVTSENADGKLVVDVKIQEDEQPGEEESLKLTDSEKTVNTVENNTDKNAAFSKQQGTDDTGAQSRNDMPASVNQNVAETNFSQVQNTVGETTSQVDVAEIMKQIVEYSKVAIGNQATTMEMQLNPENLGKIYMEITSRDGVVSAHITAQNEVVKEALESQLVELRQNLNQAGVKVEAVEVTVESHEFEKNLEQNTRQQEEQASQQEKAAKGIRRINLSDLDELSGLMTEEESLAAQIMADQGNSIDYTA